MEFWVFVSLVIGLSIFAALKLLDSVRDCQHLTREDKPHG